MLDFNDSPKPQEANPDAQRDEIRAALIARLESVLYQLLPAGKVLKGKFVVGDVLGSPGDSLEIVLDGDKAGLWTDRATGEGGDLFALIAAHHHINVHADFPKVLELANDLLGRTQTVPPKKRKKEIPVDDLGPATAKWDYLDAHGNLLACVYRYDPPGRKKEFRPWDAKKRKPAPPNPRPLYNQSGIAAAAQVILVEGEKCAQVLIDAGICATTAMHGANAPVDKTDWSPLAGKTVLIWPDRDKPGWDYAEHVSQAILAAGASSCTIMLPPEDKPEGWDAADAIEEGFDIAGFLIAGECMPIRLAVDEVLPPELLSGVDWRTEDGLAIAFTRHHGNDWRYCAQWGKWLVWTGVRWNPDQVLYVSHLARSVCRAASKQADSPRLKAKIASSSTISALEKIARSDPMHASTAEEWDADVWTFNTPGGVIDLRTARMRAHCRTDRMTKIATATPQGNCPTWRAFLDEVTGHDPGLVAYLQRMAGYCLTGVTSEHALFFLYGTGANGKSVFLNVLATILGDYARHAPMEMFMSSISERHPTELAMLRGARLVIATETEQGARWNESRIKEITGGDRVSARFMRQDYFEFVPQFKLVISGNHKPVIRNADEAMRRRLHLIPFTVTIPPEKRDSKLTEKLLAERNGILAWALEGCQSWQRDGLRPPAVVLEATREYFNEEDAVQEFEETEIERDPQSQVAIGMVFGRWKTFAEARGYYAGSARWLSEQLVLRGYNRVRMGGGIRGLRGLRLRFKEDSWTPYPDN